MTDRESRQRRLLSVRCLQADLAAARVRALRSQQQQDESELVASQVALQCPIGTAHADWLLACAERELAHLRIGQLLSSMEQRLPQLQVETAAEQLCSQQREQMQHLCDRSEATTRVAAGRTEQGRLDDMFSAARLRRLALANPNP